MHSTHMTVCPSNTASYRVHMYRFGGLFHDLPESYFKAQASRGGNLVGVFKQALGAAKAQKAVKQRNILSKMFPNARLASTLSNQVGTQCTHTSLAECMQANTPFALILHTSAKS